MCRRVERFLLAVAPAELRDWIAAILWEAQYLDPRDRLQWYLGAAVVGARWRVGRSVHLQAATLATVMLAVDWTSGALFPALGFIAASAAILTRGSSSRALAFMVTGGTLPIAHAVANWIPRLRPDYQYAALDLRDWIILTSVALIGICAVHVAESFPWISPRSGI